MRALALLAALALACCASASRIDPLHMDDATFDREVAQRFQYGPPQPAPTELSDQRAGQIADAAYFSAFPTADRSYTPAARAEAQRLATQLRTDAGNLSHEQFVLRVAEIAALADNGHTAIGENAFKKNTPRIPLRTYLFADGLYVLYANAANTDLLGARIDTIEGHSIDDIYRVIRRYRGGTEAFRRIELLPMLESPGLLKAAGLAQSNDALTLTGVLANGARFERRVTAEQRDRSAWVSNTSRLLFPDRLANTGMTSFLHTDHAMPISLHGESQLFYVEPMAPNGLYVRIDYNNDADDNPIGPFLDSVLARVRSEHPGFVVLDMRMNSGGDYTKTYAFAHDLPVAADAAHVYVLTAPWTFSAAITTVATLKQAGGDHVTIVGDDVGDRLDFWAEGGQFALPNAFVTVSYAAGRHVYNGPCRNLEQCFWLNYRYPVRVRSLAPDIRAPLTFAAYREGHDPALDAVTAREARSGSSARTP